MLTGSSREITLYDVVIVYTNKKVLAQSVTTVFWKGAGGWILDNWCAPNCPKTQEDAVLIVNLNLR